MLFTERFVLKKEVNEWLMLFLAVSFFFFSCQDAHRNPQSNATQYANYCGSCHLIPDPSSIPKDVWKNTVLPEMGARMGYKYDGYDPNRFKSPLEKIHINLS